MYFSYQGSATGRGEGGKIGNIPRLLDLAFQLLQRDDEEAGNERQVVGLVFRTRTYVLYPPILELINFWCRAVQDWN